MFRSDKLVLLTVLITSGLFFYLQLQWQSPLDYNSCDKCDGNQYETLVDYFNGVEGARVNHPFSTRILVPFLVALLGSFLTVNLAFSLIAIITLFLLWKKLELPRWLIVGGFLWLIFHWSGMIRLNIFDPATVDVPIYFFHACLLLIIFSKRYGWLPLLSILATSQKESFLAYLILLAIVAILNRKEFPWKVIMLSLLFGVTTKLVLNHYFPPIEEGKGMLITVAFHLKQVVLNPLLLARWVTAVFMAYGFFLIIPKKWVIIDVQEKLLLGFVLLSGFLALIGGGDYTRILFLGFPFIMTWAMIRINEMHPKVVLAMLLLSLPVMRLYSTIPVPDVDVSNHSWYAEFMEVKYLVYWIAYFALGALTIFVLSSRTHK